MRTALRPVVEVSVRYEFEYSSNHTRFQSECKRAVGFLPGIEIFPITVIRGREIIRTNVKTWTHTYTIVSRQYCYLDFTTTTRIFQR